MWFLNKKLTEASMQTHTESICLHSPSLRNLSSSNLKLVDILGKWGFRAILICSFSQVNEIISDLCYCNRYHQTPLLRLSFISAAAQLYILH